MAVTRQQKEEILKGLTEDMKGSKSVFFAKNLGLSVGQSQTLRRALREGGSRFSVAKKTLLRKAAQDGLNIDLTDTKLEGAIGAAFLMEDELEGLKVIAKIAKETKKIEIVGGIFEGKALSLEDAVALSKVPSREELLSKMLGSLQSPLSGFVGVGNQLLAGFARVLDAYREQKESA